MYRASDPGERVWARIHGVCANTRLGRRVRTSAGAWVIAVTVLSESAPVAAGTLGYPWLPNDEARPGIAERIAPPAGAERILLAEGAFGEWLRHLPLLPGTPPVLLFDGSPKIEQTAHVAVVDLEVGSRDLQQCADAVIRLRAEWLWASGRKDEIAFDFTSGDRASWAAWRAGERPVVVGSFVRWMRRAPPEDSRAAFRSYLETVFRYAGSASLERELTPVEREASVVPGDVFIQGGHPGHAVLVVDVAEDVAASRRYFLLAQSYMPAQQVHLLRNPARADPWYLAGAPGPLVTPEWIFPPGSLRRFSPATMPVPIDRPEAPAAPRWAR